MLQAKVAKTYNTKIFDFEKQEFQHNKAIKFFMHK